MRLTTRIIALFLTAMFKFNQYALFNMNPFSNPCGGKDKGSGLHFSHQP